MKKISFIYNFTLSQLLLSVKSYFLATLVISICFLSPLTSFAEDMDADGIDDRQDNCIEIPNSDQRDSNNDGYGNLCDADLDNNGTVSFADLNLFKSKFGTADQDADFDGNGSVSFADLSIFKNLFGKPPGPAGNSNNVISKQQASQFLARGTFGPTDEDILHLQNLGSYQAWLEEQFATPPSYHIAWAENHTEGINGTGNLSDHPEDWKTYADTLGYMQRDIWWHIATQGSDQLRQRIALALSELLVISKHNGKLITWPDARMSYYDTLVKNALGNYETLLQEVTYHPSMGSYLSYLGNAKADPEKGTHPDENYAREVMQLFTIGLYELNPDGSKKLDSERKPIPTYSQKDIREMAKVFTGLTDQNGFFFADDGGSSHASRTQSMIAMEEYHDTSEKQLFGGSEIIASGGTTKGDINQALHILFMHPNTGPFVARRLIQRLVTSNPSPAYIQRVADAFDNNGSGVRGDLKAVVKAILLDPEAFNGVQTMPEKFGKFREPLLYFTHLFRAFHAKDDMITLNIYDGGPSYRYQSYNFNGTDMTKQEAPLEALTVFNYFTPDDGPFSLKQFGLVAPEISLYGKQGIDEVLMGIINKNGFIYETFNLHADLLLDKETAWVESKNYDALLDYLDTLLTGGNMSNTTKLAIKNYLISHENENDDEGNPLTNETLARYAIGLVITSPDYALQR